MLSTIYSILDEWTPNIEGEGETVWLINNGHGRLQPGKRSPLFGLYDKIDPRIGEECGERRFFEWWFNRQVARALYAKMTQRRVLVVPEDNVDDFLRTRVARGNTLKAKKKIWLSIHANAASAEPRWNVAHGCEVFYGSQPGLAQIFQEKLVALGLRDRGIKKGTHLYEIRRTSMPAILIEVGFFDNKEEALWMLSHINEIADAILEGIKECGIA